MLRMWPHSAQKAEVFVNAFLSSLGYPRLENVAPLGGKDGGRDLQSHDGSLIVACYFPVKRYRPYEDIEAKFLSDMEKAQKVGAIRFTFVTGQVLQLAEKVKLKARSFTKDTDVFDCNDILNVVCAPEAGFLRAELGFHDKNSSYDHDFFEALFATVSFSNLIHLFNDSLEPKIFPSGFFELFDTLEIFNRTAQPDLLSQDLKEAYVIWVDAVYRFHEQLLGIDQFDYVFENQTFVMKRIPYPQFQGVCNEVSAAFVSLTQGTTQLAGLVAEKLRIAVR